MWVSLREGLRVPSLAFDAVYRSSITLPCVGLAWPIGRCALALGVRGVRAHELLMGHLIMHRIPFLLTPARGSLWFVRTPCVPIHLLQRGAPMAFILSFLVHIVGTLLDIMALVWFATWQELFACVMLIAR